MKKILYDISGAFGDIGMFFPIAITFIANTGMNPTALFVTAGIFYIVSAYYFRITMPVQPLKAVFAIAIASGLGYEIINAAGIVMGIILIIIGTTRISARLGKLFPLPVIRGIQLGLGAMLMKTSFTLIMPDIVIATVAGIILFVTVILFKNIPPFIPMLVLGAILTIKNCVLSSSIGPVSLLPALPLMDDVMTGLILLVLPQLALTFGNSIVATNATGRLLYGDKAKRLNLQSIALSIGFANIVSGLLGGAPMCHGSSGLTAHNKFGATDQNSGYFIGFFFIVLALVFGHSAVAIISAFPIGMLGVLLWYVGFQHTLFIKDIVRERSAIVIAFVVGILGFALNNLTIGFLVGIALHYGLLGIKAIANYRWGISSDY
jgi:SulP family sulfate permease